MPDTLSVGASLWRGLRAPSRRTLSRWRSVDKRFGQILTQPTQQQGGRPPRALPARRANWSSGSGGTHDRVVGDLGKHGGQLGWRSHRASEGIEFGASSDRGTVDLNDRPKAGELRRKGVRLRVGAVNLARQQPTPLRFGWPRPEVGRCGRLRAAGIAALMAQHRGRRLEVHPVTRGLHTQDRRDRSSLDLLDLTDDRRAHRVGRLAHPRSCLAERHRAVPIR